MKKFIIPIVLFVFSLGNIYSQDQKVEFGLRGGFSYNMPNSSNDTIFNTSGVHFGPMITYNINEVLGIQTGILYNYNATNNILINLKKTEGNWNQNRAETQSIDIPLRLKYSVPLTDEIFVHLLAGPNLNYGLTYKVYEEKYADNKMLTGYPKLIKDYYSTTSNFSRFDLQFGIGAGIQYSHYSLTGGYDWGLLDRDKSTKKLKINNIKIGIAYTF